MAKINKSEIFKSAWESLRYFIKAGIKVNFAMMLRRSWSFARAKANPRPLDLSGWTRGS